jgi:predicted ATPase
LVFEDVHWCDSESLAFLLALLSHAGSKQRLIMFTHRSDHPIGWPQLPSVVSRQLTNLPPHEAEAMLRRLLGESDELMPVRRLLVERAGGNPFFLEESAQSLIDGGVLFGTPGSYQLRGEFENLQLPETIDALISARVDRLPLTTLQALEALAVAGDETPANLLCHVLNLPESVLEERLWLLLQAELVFRVSDDDSAVYRLKHALIRDVVYRRLVRARRKALHMRVMHAIEHVYKVRLAEHVEQLAEHANRAELWEKSIAYHQMACQRALRRWANTQALAHIERSLAMVKYLPEGDPRDRVALDLRLLALAPVVPSGDHERMIALLLEAEELADKLKDRRRGAALASQLAFGCWMLGQYERSVAYALKVIDFTGDVEREIGLRESAYYNLAMSYHAQGKLEAALEILRPQRERFSGADAGKQMRAWAGYPGVYIRTFMIAALSLLGGFDEAARAYEEGRRVADHFDHPHSRTMIMEEYGYCLWIRGEYAAARALLGEALEVSERDDVLVMHTPIVARLGVAMVHAGELEAGLSLLTRELEQETYRHAAHYGLVFLLIALSEAKLIAGDVAAALAHAEHAMRVTAEAGEQAYRVCALLQLAAAREADPQHAAGARALYEECEREAERLRMKPWQAFVLQQSARSLTDRAHAREQLRRALALWNELSAPVRAAEVRAELERKQPSV